jgi:hypothetical protein
MKIQTATTLATALATVLMVPAAFGQQSTFRIQEPNRATPVPSSPILPMTNPVAPMTNPVGPAIASPNIHYPGTTPTVANPAQGRGGRGNDNRPNNDSDNRNDGRGSRGGDGRGNGRGREVVVVPVPADYYYPTFYYEPTVPTVTIPGQLPGVPYQYNNRATSFNPTPDKPAPTPPTSTFVYVPQPDPDEPRLIINEPRPNRVVQPPAAGTSRSDVILRYGQPWGQFSTRGIETLYFDGLTVVFGPDGRVTSTR